MFRTKRVRRRAVSNLELRRRRRGRAGSRRKEPVARRADGGLCADCVLGSVLVGGWNRRLRGRSAESVVACLPAAMVMCLAACCRWEVGMRGIGIQVHLRVLQYERFLSQGGRRQLP